MTTAVKVILVLALVYVLINIASEAFYDDDDDDDDDNYKN